MPRPRTHDLDQVLDAAEHLIATRGAAELTVRGLATESGVSNGAIYHAFGSLPALLARVWLRAATDFLDRQETLATEAGDPEEAVRAAARAPAVFAGDRPDAARMLLTVRKENLLGPRVPDELAEALHALDNRVLALLVRLAKALWNRGDGAAVEVITTCVVDLPTALFRRELAWPGGAVGTDTERRLTAAVRAVLAIPPPDRGS
ncbi:TetR/AcrR family transcriptional regulator [Sciscionella marina]|uniref:TetR/AcrR family transcriptional regulator n=1 Tax=Sciscionella marina TaxID=508770 RepID=UPI00037EA82C|nr:TetR/AcrR family transcriptional regulator [Sciscionella marina]